MLLKAINKDAFDNSFDLHYLFTQIKQLQEISEEYVASMVKNLFAVTGRPLLPAKMKLAKDAVE